jgi:hypothetical protein
LKFHDVASRRQAVFTDQVAAATHYGRVPDDDAPQCAFGCRPKRICKWICFGEFLRPFQARQHGRVARVLHARQQAIAQDRADDTCGDHDIEQSELQQPAPPRPPLVEQP